MKMKGLSIFLLLCSIKAIPLKTGHHHKADAVEQKLPCCPLLSSHLDESRFSPIPWNNFPEHKDQPHSTPPSGQRTHLRAVRDTGARLSITSSLDILRDRMFGQQAGRRVLTSKRPRRGQGETGNLVRIG